MTVYGWHVSVQSLLIAGFVALGIAGLIAARAHVYSDSERAGGTLRRHTDVYRPGNVRAMHR